MSKVAFIFPGQGAQKCGMGKDFYEQSSKAKAIFDRASVIFPIFSCGRSVWSFSLPVFSFLFLSDILLPTVFFAV